MWKLRNFDGKTASLLPGGAPVLCYTGKKEKEPFLETHIGT